MDVLFDWRWWIIGKYHTIWDKVGADVKKGCDSEPVYNKELLETKIKSHSDKLQIFLIKNY